MTKNQVHTKLDFKNHRVTAMQYDTVLQYVLSSLVHYQQTNTVYFLKINQYKKKK